MDRYIAISSKINFYCIHIRFKEKKVLPTTEGLFEFYLRIWIGLPIATSAASIVISPSVGCA
jgi:hypothetical protein